MTKNLSVTATYSEVENGWIQARIMEIPGVITAAPTRAEAQELLLDALREYLLSFQEEPPTSPDQNDGETGRVNISLSA